MPRHENYGRRGRKVSPSVASLKAGDVKGKWTLLAQQCVRSGANVAARTHWLCRCACGIEKTIQPSELLRKRIQGCTNCYVRKGKPAVCPALWKTKPCSACNADFQYVQQRTVRCRTCADKHRSLAKAGIPLSVEEYRRAQAKANGVCAACLRSRGALVPDHCHRTGRFRAMICNHCNVTEGHFKDHPEALLELHKYMSSNMKAQS
jgi:hypothetical protein